MEGARVMPWIDAERVATLLRTDLGSDTYVNGLITHAQALAENEIGAQSQPDQADYETTADFDKAVTRWAALQALLAQITARMWQSGESAAINPAGFQSDTAGPFTIQDPRAGTAGLGLTDREIKALRKAAGTSSLWVQPTSRGERLETAPIHDQLEDTTDPIDTLLAAQADVEYP